MKTFRFIKITYLNPLDIAHYRISSSLIQLITTNTKSDSVQCLIKDRHVSDSKLNLHHCKNVKYKNSTPFTNQSVQIANVVLKSKIMSKQIADQGNTSWKLTEWSFVIDLQRRELNWPS